MYKKKNIYIMIAIICDFVHLEAVLNPVHKGGLLYIAAWLYLFAWEICRLDLKANTRMAPTYNYYFLVIVCATKCSLRFAFVVTYRLS